MLFNVDYFFDGNEGYGWSERYYFSGTSISDAYNAATTLLPLRQALLPTTQSILFYRASTPGKPPNSLLQAVASPAGTYALLSGSVTLPSEVAVLVAFYGTDVLKNRKFFRGLTSQDTDSDTFVPLSTWLVPWMAFITGLTGATGWVVASSYKAVGPPQTTAPLASGSYSSLLTRRKPGRPFGYARGRRRISLVA